MVAVEATGARAYVANIGSGSISILDLKRGVGVGDVFTGKGSEGIAVSPGRMELPSVAARQELMLELPNSSA